MKRPAPFAHPVAQAGCAPRQGRAPSPTPRAASRSGTAPVWAARGGEGCGADWRPRSIAHSSSCCFTFRHKACGQQGGGRGAGLTGGRARSIAHSSCCLTFRHRACGQQGGGRGAELTGGRAPSPTPPRAASCSGTGPVCVGSKGGGRGGELTRGRAPSPTPRVASRSGTGPVWAGSGAHFESECGPGRPHMMKGGLVTVS